MKELIRKILRESAKPEWFVKWENLPREERIEKIGRAHV